jgi:hypothetical protein
LSFKNKQMSQSSQALVRVGKTEDLYYADEDNTKVESIPVQYNTRFVQDLANKGGGTSVLTIPPNSGVKNVIVVLGYDAASISGQLGAQALPRGWGYRAIQQVSFRIGGSSQYFLSGQQLLNRALMMCRTGTQRDAILSLGGNECKVATDFDVDQYAYIPIPVWCAPSNDGLNIPLPTDLLSQQVQITVTLNPSASIFTGLATGGGAPAPVALPAAFDTAYFQVEQLIMTDRSMSLANKVDMDTHMYVMPLPSFSQQELTFSPVATTAVQQLTLTGFRAGEVRKVVCWLTLNSEDGFNSLVWYAPKQATLLYAGEIYADYRDGSSQLWNLIDGTAPAAVNTSDLATGAGSWTSTPALSQWVELPFANPTGDDYSADVYTHGKEILNGVANLQIALPTASAYTLHVQYIYNASVGFSRGSADIIF